MNRREDKLSYKEESKIGTAGWRKVKIKFKTEMKKKNKKRTGTKRNKKEKNWRKWEWQRREEKIVEKRKAFCSKTNLKISCKARDCIKQFFIPSMNFKMASKNIEKFKSRTHTHTHTETTRTFTNTHTKIYHLNYFKNKFNSFYFFFWNL